MQWLNFVDGNTRKRFLVQCLLAQAVVRSSRLKGTVNVLYICNSVHTHHPPEKEWKKLFFKYFSRKQFVALQTV